MLPFNYKNRSKSDDDYNWINEKSTEAHGWLIPKIFNLLPENRHNVKILDIGCGNGFTASCLAEKGFDVIGIDVSRKGIEIARKAYPGIRFEVASAYDDLTSIAPNVDVVLAMDVIEHLYSPKLFMERLYDVLNAGGVLIITTPYHGYLKNLALSIFNKWDFHHTVDWEGGHIKFFSEKTLSEFLNRIGFINLTFHNAGRMRWFWKSMVCRCYKPDTQKS